MEKAAQQNKKSSAAKWKKQRSFFEKQTLLFWKI